MVDFILIELLPGFLQKKNLVINNTGQERKMQEIFAIWF